MLADNLCQASAATCGLLMGRNKKGTTPMKLSRNTTRIVGVSANLMMFSPKVQFVRMKIALALG